MNRPDRSGRECTAGIPPMPSESTSLGGSSGVAQRLLLRGIPWYSYEALLNELRSQPVRLTYDRGSLELLELTGEHGMCVRLVARLVGDLSKYLDVPVLSGRPTTFKRRDASRGLEPDKYYYFSRELPGRGLREILPDYDRPPDLALEVDLEGSRLDRLAIYAALGFPEVWRHDGTSLRVHRLRGDGRYAVGASSPSFPFPHLTSALRLLRECETMGDSGLVPSLPTWIRKVADRRFRGSIGEGGPAGPFDDRRAAAPPGRPTGAGGGADGPHEVGSADPPPRPIRAKEVGRGR